MNKTSCGKSLNNKIIITGELVVKNIQNIELLIMSNSYSLIHTYCISTS